MIAKQQGSKEPLTRKIKSKSKNKMNKEFVSMIMI